MKRLIVIAAVVAGSLCASAQTEAGRWTLMPKVGLNWAKTTDPEIYVSDAPGPDGKVQVERKMGLALGAEAEYQCSRQVSLSAGLVYSQQGSRWADVEDLWANYKTTVDYLTVPVLLNLYIAPGLAVKAGVQPAVKLRSKTDYDDRSFTANGHVASTISDYRTLELGIPVGASYAIGPWQLELRYDIGLTYMRKLGDLWPEKNRVLQLTLGYRLGL